MSCLYRADVLRQFLWLGLVLSAISSLAVEAVRAQPASGGTTAPAAEPAQVVIEREPLVLRSPETYRVSLNLKPLKTVEVTARTDGVVGTILLSNGKDAREQAEILRLDSRERQIELERARAAFQAAQIEQRAAGQGTDKELADIRLQIAKHDLDLAEYRLDQTIHRAPFGGTVQAVHVVEGQFVRAGQPLATLVDPSRLSVQIPIERPSVNTGDAIDVQVEGKVAKATVQQILPLTEPFEPLRELFESIATGVAVIENGGGEWQAGQTVYASLIPRYPVTEVPNGAIGNSSEGGRRVQVIRDGFVRDVPVELLAAVGETRTIVTGAFGAKDELIVRTSQELTDGTQVVPRTELVATPSSGAGASTPAPVTPSIPAGPGGRAPRQVVPPAAR